MSSLLVVKSDTCKINVEYKGTIVFLCDDPDLMFTWKAIPNEEWSRWVFWFNSPFSESQQRETGYLRDEPSSKIFDAPFGSLLRLNEPSDKYFQHGLAYIGRKDGRTKVLQSLSSAPVSIYGRAKEWTGSGFEPMVKGEPPAQPERANFYHWQTGAICLADQKHKKLGWRTGRAYHAISAGCPVIVEKDHKALGNFVTFENAIWVSECYEKWKDYIYRR